VKEEEEKVRPVDREDALPAISAIDFFFGERNARRVAPRCARTRAPGMLRLNRNKRQSPVACLFPSFFRLNPCERPRRGDRRVAMIATRTMRGFSSFFVLTIPSTRAHAGGSQPTHHRRRVQPAEAHTQSLQPRRTAVPRVLGYLDSVQKRRLHHGTGAYPARI